MHKLSTATRHFVAAASCVAACLPSAAAFADCESRKTRPAETAFNARAMAALVAAFPPAPSGVVAVDAKPFDFKNPPGIYEVLCDFSKEGDFSITASRRYVRKHSEAERKYWSAQYDQVTAQLHALRKTPPDKAAEQQVLRQQSNAAWQVMRDAEKAGDKIAAQASNEKYRSLRNQADKIDAQHQDSVKPQLRELDQRRIAIDPERQQVDVVMSMNLQQLRRAGADDSSLVHDRYGTASPGKSVELKVHNVAWSAVGADGTLRQALVAAIERARLQLLVGKPLPSVAESDAAAARAVPTQVADLPASALADSAAATTTAAAVTAAPAAPAAPARPPVPSLVPSLAASPAPPPAPSPAPPPAPTPGTDPVKKAADAVNLLRGLLGR